MHDLERFMSDDTTDAKIRALHDRFSDAIEKGRDVRRAERDKEIARLSLEGHRRAYESEQYPSRRWGK